MASPQALKRLRAFTSCDIGDALVKLKYPHGGFLDGVRLVSSPSATATSTPSPTRIFGPAITVEMVPADSSEPSLSKHFVDHNKRDHIMYIHQPDKFASACWGGLMSTRAKYLGAAGVIVNGRIRDVNEHPEIGFPVFSKSTSILGSNTFTKAAKVNIPLQFKDDLWIHPDDIFIGDDDGVVVVPPKLVEHVVELCQERADIDEKMFAGLRKGEAMGDLIQKFRKGSGK